MRTIKLSKRADKALGKIPAKQAKQIASCKLYFTDLLTPEKISRGAEGNEGRERIVDHMDGMIDQSLRSFSDIC